MVAGSLGLLVAGRVPLQREVLPANGTGLKKYGSNESTKIETGLTGEIYST
jgi:hypothetical protein